MQNLLEVIISEVETNISIVIWVVSIKHNSRNGKCRDSYSPLGKTYFKNICRWRCVLEGLS